MIKKGTIFLFFVEFLTSMWALKLLNLIEEQKDFIHTHGGEMLIKFYPIMITGLAVIGFLFLVLGGISIVNLIKQYWQNAKLYKAANQGDFRN